MPPSLSSLVAQLNLTPMLETMSARLFSNPLTAALQAGVIFGAALLIFLIFFATRDVLLRSRSLLMQVFSILLVASLPVIGFLVYLLIRPARTVREREMERVVQALFQSMQEKSGGRGRTSGARLSLRTASGPRRSASDSGGRRGLASGGEVRPQGVGVHQSFPKKPAMRVREIKISKKKAEVTAALPLES